MLPGPTYNPSKLKLAVFPTKVLPALTEFSRQWQGADKEKMCSLAVKAPEELLEALERLGCVIDGVSRDIDEYKELNLPVYGRGFIQQSIRNRCACAGYGIAVALDGVPVCSERPRSQRAARHLCNFSSTECAMKRRPSRY